MRNLADFPDAHLRLFERPAPPEPGAVRDIYLIGICGTGMGSLAGLFREAGYEVRGSDDAVYPPMSTRLAEMGIPVAIGYDENNLSPHPELTVVGNACTPTHPEAAHVREHGLAQMSLPEALAHFFIRDRRSLVVAGTHGKTTTTGMLTHLLRAARRDPGYLIGGVMVNTGGSYAVGSGAHFVVEGDEYDSAYFDKKPKFMHYRPSCAIITSMEFDHADIYHDWDDYRSAFEEFAGTLNTDGLLVLNGDDEQVRRLADFTSARVLYYGLRQGSEVTATNVRRVEGGQRFSLVVGHEELADVYLPLSGKHNLANALAAAAVAFHEGLSAAEIANGFAAFAGLRRRQEVRGEAGGVLVVDDFAHHPTAVRETIAAIRERWPNRRLIAVFEPRSNSSRRKVFEDAYAEAFSGADGVLISDPPVRHNDIADELMDTGVVISAIRAKGIAAASFSGADTMLPYLLDHLEPGDTALIMSNGAFGNIHERLLNLLTEAA
jgi:UDP-N-acetylmuramate: L-alanyl-gamma-D-glutamyl-meso-diaminopimelate ligase